MANPFLIQIGHWSVLGMILALPVPFVRHLFQKSSDGLIYGVNMVAYCFLRFPDEHGSPAGLTSRHLVPFYRLSHLMVLSISMQFADWIKDIL